VEPTGRGDVLARGLRPADRTEGRLPSVRRASPLAPTASAGVCGSTGVLSGRDRSSPRVQHGRVGHRHGPDGHRPGRLHGRGRAGRPLLHRRAAADHGPRRWGRGRGRRDACRQPGPGSPDRRGGRRRERDGAEPDGRDGQRPVGWVGRAWQESLRARCSRSTAPWSAAQHTIAADGTLSPKTPAPISTGPTGDPLSIATSRGGPSVYVVDGGLDDVAEYSIGADGALSPKAVASFETGGFPDATGRASTGRARTSPTRTTA
jgi:hypothetical protein